MGRSGGSAHRLGRQRGDSSGYPDAAAAAEQGPQRSDGGRRRRNRSRAPRWARVCTMLGALLVLVSGAGLVGFEAVLARYEGSVQEADLFGDEAAGTVPEKKSDIKGPLNILLVGIDPRTKEWSPLADSIMVLHVNETLDSAYLFSLPRDLLVRIPAFDKADYRGGTEKLNAAMAHGSKVPGEKLPSAAQGFELLSRTVSEVTGIERFDAGAIINFNGFQKIVDAMGGVDMYIDTNVKSEHRQPNGKMRTLKPGGGGYTGPQAQYRKGDAHLSGWQALDYVRQRYGLPNGDYDRQRHQQQFVRAMADQALSKDVVTNPIKLDSVLRAAGESLIFNGRGHDLVEFAFALRGLRSDSIQMIKLPGGGVTQGGSYQGERFQPIAEEFFASIRTGTVDSFVISNPELLNKAR
ncbi:LCP family protein [Plantactinospora sp. BB1]|uniref:LCP family protein n=1 Tax=Plantactinospora sp. BB1 TaxID=2071627 RepID=UPI001F183581|nr:LCP family protein [Plantactinospora sp. BB1]